MNEQATNTNLTCGQSLIKLLEMYDVDTVFGIPGVHTLELYRGLADSPIHHVLVRHEQGAGFMADGYARVSGKPGVCVLITGPGMTNAATPIGQAYSDSVPMLIISSVNDIPSLGKGWGRLHEVTDQRAAFAPLTAFSATAMTPDEVPALMAQAFTRFAGQRPRPVHIEIPIDVLPQVVTTKWWVSPPPSRPGPNGVDVKGAVDLLLNATQPMFLVGNGAAEARRELTQLAERLACVVVTTQDGKGVISDFHPLSISGSLVWPETRQYLETADVIFAIGTEFAETSGFWGPVDLKGKIIRVDIDPTKINDSYPRRADVGITADAKLTAAAMLAELDRQAVALPSLAKRAAAHQTVARIKESNQTGMQPLQQLHQRVLAGIRRALPYNAIIMTDMTQIAYTGPYSYPVSYPRQWIHPSGYGTLGYALPAGIGAKLARPDLPIAVLIGDGGFMFMVQELATAVEQNLSLPIILWNNDALGQIMDDMNRLGIPPIGVSPKNPDFVMLAQAFGAAVTTPQTIEAMEAAIVTALYTEGPTIIQVRQDQM